jgi:hypothetical protein
VVVHFGESISQVKFIVNNYFTSEAFIFIGLGFWTIKSPPERAGAEEAGLLIFK